MNKIIKMDFEEVYERYYTRLPKITALIVSILVGLVGLIDILASTAFFGDPYAGILKFLVGSEAFTSGFFALVVWAIFAAALYFMVLIISKISISQKIMVVQRLTEIKNK